MDDGDMLVTGSMPPSGINLNSCPAAELPEKATRQATNSTPGNHEKGVLSLPILKITGNHTVIQWSFIAKGRIYAKSRPFSISVRFQANGSVGRLREWHVSAKRGFVPRGLLSFV